MNTPSKLLLVKSRGLINHPSLVHHSRNAVLDVIRSPGSFRPASDHLSRRNTYIGDALKSNMKEYGTRSEKQNKWWQTKRGGKINQSEGTCRDETQDSTKQSEAQQFENLDFCKGAQHKNKSDIFDPAGPSLHTNRKEKQHHHA